VVKLQNKPKMFESSDQVWTDGPRTPAESRTNSSEKAAQAYNDKYGFRKIPEDLYVAIDVSRPSHQSAFGKTPVCHPKGCAFA
jgi:hypothetical protein